MLNVSLIIRIYWIKSVRYKTFTSEESHRVRKIRKTFIKILTNINMKLLSINNFELM